jgi:hypothetical protein
MTPDRHDEHEHGIDIEAAFADIVAHYGEVPTVEEPMAEAPGSPSGRVSSDQASHDQTDDQTDDQAPGQTRDQSPGQTRDQSPGQARDGIRDPTDDGYGERRDTEADPPPPTDEPQPVLETGWRDPLHTPATWEDEGHFIPPPPPPLPSVEPRRRAAWMALFGAPLLMLVVIVAGVGLPGWVVVGLALAFIGGFVYLVATMGGSGRSGGPGWPDDGAVV